MFIRSTFSSRLGFMARQTTRVSGELMRVNEQVATGKKINQLSDAPFSAPLLHNLRQAISEQQEFQRAANSAVSMQASIEGALSTAETLITNAREFAVQFSNDTYSADQRALGLEEITTILDEMRGIANTQFMDRYVFSGTGYDIEPFDSTYTYQASTDRMNDNVSPITSVVTGMVGSDVFQGNVDIFQNLQDLITALQTNDATGVRNTLDGFTQAVDQLAESRASIGSNMRLSIDMFDIAKSMEEQFTIELSNTEDADMAKVLSRFSEVQTQYDINLQLTSSNRTMNLFQRM
jgi:flagellar hook-associated protein 3 FlgL